MNHRGVARRAEPDKLPGVVRRFAGPEEVAPGGEEEKVVVACRVGQVLRRDRQARRAEKEPASSLLIQFADAKASLAPLDDIPQVTFMARQHFDRERGLIFTLKGT